MAAAGAYVTSIRWRSDDHNFSSISLNVNRFCAIDLIHINSQVGSWRQSGQHFSILKVTEVLQRTKAWSVHHIPYGT